MKSISRGKCALLGAAVALAMLPTGLRAQTPPASSPPPASAEPQLTPAQKQKGQTLINQFAKSMDALRSNKSLSAAQKQARMKTLAQKLDKDELAILTPAQRAQVLKERQAGIQQRQAFIKAHQAEIAEARALNAKIQKSVTPAQQKQSDAIRAAAVAQYKKIAADKSLSDQAKRQKLTALQQDTQAKLVGLMTPAQKADMQKLQQINQKLNAAVSSLGTPPK